MKSSKILLLPDNSIYEDTLIKVSASKLVKSIIVIFMLSCVSLMYSCGVFIPAPGVYAEREQHHGRGEHHMHHENRGSYEHHDNDEHHGSDEHHN